MLQGLGSRGEARGPGKGQRERILSSGCSLGSPRRDGAGGGGGSLGSAAVTPPWML